MKDPPDAYGEPDSFGWEIQCSDWSLGECPDCWEAREGAAHGKGIKAMKAKKQTLKAVPAGARDAGSSYMNVSL